MTSQLRGVTRRGLKDGACQLFHAVDKLPRNTAWHSMAPHGLPAPFNKMADIHSAVIKFNTFFDYIGGVLEEFPCPVGAVPLQSRLDQPFMGRCGGPLGHCCMPYNPAKVVGTAGFMLPAGRGRVKDDRYLGCRIKGVGVMLAHRIVCMAFWGVPAEHRKCVQGKCEKPYVIHKCGNRRCCQPHHLAWSSQQMNCITHLLCVEGLRINDILDLENRRIG